MLLLSIIVGAFMTVVPNGNKEGSGATKALMIESIPVIAVVRRTLT